MINNIIVYLELVVAVLTLNARIILLSLVCLSYFGSLCCYIRPLYLKYIICVTKRKTMIVKKKCFLLYKLTCIFVFICSYFFIIIY